jgi:hypothetical protein
LFGRGVYGFGVAFRLAVHPGWGTEADLRWAVILDVSKQEGDGKVEEIG